MTEKELIEYLKQSIYTVISAEQSPMTSIEAVESTMKEILQGLGVDNDNMNIETTLEDDKVIVTFNGPKWLHDRMIEDE